MRSNLAFRFSLRFVNDIAVQISIFDLPCAASKVNLIWHEESGNGCKRCTNNCFGNSDLF
jgi:hypothetical protein